jgi:hypothetical protein
VRAYARGKGECVIDWRSDEGSSALLAFWQQGTSLGMEAKLDLTCLGRNLEPMEIPNGARLLINIWLTDSGALDSTTDAPVYLRLELNADIYAPWSLGEIQDNALLAALNGPRLANFLERIEKDAPAQLLEMDGERYGGMVGPRGFKVPGSGGRDRVV